MTYTLFFSQIQTRVVKERIRLDTPDLKKLPKFGKINFWTAKIHMSTKTDSRSSSRLRRTKKKLKQKNRIPKKTIRFVVVVWCCYGC
jgi:hypothetical protein